MGSLSALPGCSQDLPTLGATGRPVTEGSDERAARLALYQRRALASGYADPNVVRAVMASAVLSQGGGTR